MRRGGYLYVAVLFTSLVVMAAVTAALSISTSILKGETDRTSRSDALWFVESELQRQMAIMKTSGAWRSSHTNDTFVAWHPFTLDGVNVTGDSVVRHRFTDVDGDLADDDFDSVQLTVHAKVGNSHAAVTVKLEPDPLPLDLLNYSITAGDDIRFEGGGTVVAERPVQVTDDAKTSSSGMLTTERLECSGNIQMTLRGELRGSSVTLPPRDVVAKYISMGTEIPAAAIPLSGTDLIIEDRLLTTNDNPFGPTDAAGIYWIDAGGGRVEISNCRIEATLAITNCSTIEIGGGIVWRYPLDADVILATNTYVLLDSLEPILDEDDVGVNFNPSSSPFRGTLSNATATDVYPTELRGILYSSGNMRFNPMTDGSTLRVFGSIIGRDIRFDGHVAIHPLDEVLQTPPPGLSDPTPMRLIRGSYRRIPTP